jgi:hypothetical protein
MSEFLLKWITESVKEKLLDQLSPDLRSVIDEYLIANDRLKLDKEIGRGRVKVIFSILASCCVTILIIFARFV